MAANPDSIFETIEFTLNGSSVEALPGETILQAAQRTGTQIVVDVRAAEGDVVADLLPHPCAGAGLVEVLEHERLKIRPPLRV